MSPRGSALAVVWAQYGPYHFARTRALAKLLAPATVYAVELANRTRDYEWQRSATGLNLITLCPDDVAEQLSFTTVFTRARREFARLGVDTCFLPSYSPKQSLAALLAAKSLGLKTVMMNETHAGTARAAGPGTWVKQRLLGLFEAALVGGMPQKRYFASMGMPEEKIFTGYDAVDNNSFTRGAGEAMTQAANLRSRLALPEHYFLSLGRFVAKKNLGTLIQAYKGCLEASRLGQTHLVLVGSGEEEAKLRALCSSLRLPVYNKTPADVKNPKSNGHDEEPGVHFYGFRQMEENAVFYALADAFILPSLREEWGLVVNEAMACGLPVIVSQTAGCAEDLLEPGCPLPKDEADTKPGGVGQLERLNRLVRANGFVFDPASSGELSSVLLAMESMPAVRAAMGRESRRIVEKFSCANFAQNALKAASAARGEGQNDQDEPCHPGSQAKAPQKSRVSTIAGAHAGDRFTPQN